MEYGGKAEELATEFCDPRNQIVRVQEVLLPDSLPVIPGLDLSARYLLAADDTAAGGDWFDAVPLPDGGVALVLGDVVGHGVTASAAMGQLRAVLRRRLIDGASLPQALAELDVVAGAVPDARAATVCLVRVTPDGSGVEYCTAGHPPPLVITTAGEARYLEPTGSGPLASGSSYASRSATLGPHDVVVLYSDGLVERPGRARARETVELLEVARNAALGRAVPGAGSDRVVERVCEQTLELLTRLSGHSDDMTILAASRTAVQRPLHMSAPPQPAVLAAFRAGLASWLDAYAVRAIDRISVQHAVGELVSNAVEHAFVRTHGCDALVTLTAAVDRSGILRVAVGDTGRWRPPAADHDGAAEPAQRSCGLGLVLAETVARRLIVTTGDAGTTVELEMPLTRPAGLLDDRPPPAPAPGDGHRERPFGARCDDLTGRLTVSGPVDIVSARRLEEAVLRAARGGTTPVAVELSDVSILASSGVSVLLRLHREGRCTVVAAPGTTAQHVLDIVRLPYDASPTG